MRGDSRSRWRTLIEWRPWRHRQEPPEVEPKPKPKPEPSGAERRRSVRYGIGLDTSARLLAMLKSEPSPVRVRNISAGGISLVAQHGVESGTILDIELLNRPTMFLCKLQVRITYAVEHPSGDWILGGAFVEKLSDEDVKSLLV